MTPVGLSIFVVLSVALAAFVQGYGGFGFGIISMALLALLGGHMAGLAVVTTLAATAVISTLLLISHGDGHIHWRKGILILAGAALGQPLGYWFITSFGDRPVFRFVFGVVLLLFAANGLLGPHRRWRVPDWTAVGVGVLGGFLGGAFVAGGPPVILYLYSQDDDPRRMKATVQFVFVTNLFYRLALIGVAGDYSRASIGLAAMAIPLAIPVLVWGHWLSRRSSVSLFRRAVYILVFGFGLLLIGRALTLWLD